jgi:hypothetical protein
MAATAAAAALTALAAVPGLHCQYQASCLMQE